MLLARQDPRSHLLLAADAESLDAQPARAKSSGPAHASSSPARRRGRRRRGSPHLRFRRPSRAAAAAAAEREGGAGAVVSSPRSGRACRSTEGEREKASSREKRQAFQPEEREVKKISPSLPSSSCSLSLSLFSPFLSISLKFPSSLSSSRAFSRARSLSPTSEQRARAFSRRGVLSLSVALFARKQRGERESVGKEKHRRLFFPSFERRRRRRCPHRRRRSRAMAASRKLQQEIERTIKRINEGCDEFDQIWDKVGLE